MTDNVSILNIDDKTIYLLGTAHVSKDSAEEAYNLIKEVNPDTVCIELDKERYDNLINPQKWKDTDIFTVIKQKRSSYLLVNIILSSYQKRLASKLDSSAGKEMLRSIEAANEINANILTADRNIKTTFMRVWRHMGFLRKIKLLFQLILGFLDDEEITEEDLEEIKSQDMLTSALTQLGEQFPDVKKYLVDERDVYLSQKIRHAKGKTIVAVVGAAHVGGIKHNITTEIDLSKIDVIPPASLFGKAVGWLIPAVILFMIVSTLISDINMGLEQMKQWVLYNGTLSAIGTVLAGGHILSVLTAFVCAPITSLNPLLAAGWFAGLVEAYVRKPTVNDFDKLSDDLSSIKGLWKNKLTKVLLVVVLANIGSVVGTYAGGIEIFKIFKEIF